MHSTPFAVILRHTSVAPNPPTTNTTPQNSPEPGNHQTLPTISSNSSPSITQGDNPTKASARTADIGSSIGTAVTISQEPTSSVASDQTTATSVTFTSSITSISTSTALSPTNNRAALPDAEKSSHRWYHSEDDGVQLFSSLSPTIQIIHNLHGEAVRTLVSDVIPCAYQTFDPAGRIVGVDMSKAEAVRQRSRLQANSEATNLDDDVSTSIGNISESHTLTTSTEATEVRLRQIVQRMSDRIQALEAQQREPDNRGVWGIVDGLEDQSPPPDYSDNGRTKTIVRSIGAIHAGASKPFPRFAGRDLKDYHHFALEADMIFAALVVLIIYS
ncbi:hypothetical protein D9615_002032 [Tricholomella constricta]|uniref:Uncharacterized protein n=1 Tax=Tricholomella constricta TaxID=117010 RepID=A0A8H5MAF0_9AGAR|nr:hypothetical protein D9615_002032 [Tricholomella constricta]